MSNITESKGSAADRGNCLGMSPGCQRIKREGHYAARAFDHPLLQFRGDEPGGTI